MPKLIEVEPGELHSPPGRAKGADPYKLARQTAKHGDALDGMPRSQVVQGKGELLGARPESSSMRANI